MFEIKIQHSFPAGHHLRDYVGKCANPHGHNYRVVAVVQGEQLNTAGLLIDFADLKKAVRSICERLDHQYLNDIPPFDTRNPTAENIAAYLYDELGAAIGAHGVRVKEIELWETDTAAVVYRP